MKKGFTLIELLAVIVILAIIALIATPIILNIIGGTKDKSEDLSKELYLRAVNQAIATRNLTEEFNPSECTIQEDGNLLCGEKNLLVEVSGTKPCSGTITFDEKGKITNETVKFTCEHPYIDASGANAPDLMNDSLTPVIYNTDHWEIADITSEWYDYDKQEWANAVILNDEVSTSPGTRIYPEGDNVNIKAMFVWIPRYSYTISSEAKGDKSTCTKTIGGDYDCYPNPGAIDIKFVDVNTKGSGSAEYTDSIGDTWYTHPAFTFGEEELSGIWVGKFETTGTGTEPTILPSVSSLRNQVVVTQFKTAQLFNSYTNSVGDAHMAKNSEWGAVAYLSQSKYGKYGNEDYTGANKEVYENKSRSYITGNSNGTPSQSVYSKTQCKYDDVTNRGNGTGSCGGGASTTGNITGVYDMSGGADEYVMGVYKKIFGSSGFGSFPAEKYFDNYLDNDVNNETYKGHALGETSNWYGDSAYFATTDAPWFRRGNSYSNDVGAGVFAFDYSFGNKYALYSFRVVFSPIT